MCPQLSIEKKDYMAAFMIPGRAGNRSLSELMII